VRRDAHVAVGLGQAHEALRAIVDRIVSERLSLVVTDAVAVEPSVAVVERREHERIELHVLAGRGMGDGDGVEAGRARSGPSPPIQSDGLNRAARGLRREGGAGLLRLRFQADLLARHCENGHHTIGNHGIAHADRKAGPLIREGSDFIIRRRDG